MSLNVNYWATSGNGNAGSRFKENDLYTYNIVRNGVSTQVSNVFKAAPIANTVEVALGSDNLQSMVNLRNRIQATTYAFPKTISNVESISGGRRCEIRIPRINGASNFRIQMNIRIDGNIIMAIDKTISSAASSSTNVQVQPTYQSTLTFLLSNLNTNNADTTQIRYTKGTINGLDENTIYIDVFPKDPFTSITFTDIIRTPSSGTAIFNQSDYATTLYRFSYNIFSEGPCSSVTVNSLSFLGQPALLINPVCDEIVQPDDLDNSDIIFTGSPYWLTYTNTSAYTFTRLELYVYRGGINNIPAVATYSFDKYKVISQDTSVSFNISDFVDGLINPKLTEDWFSSGSTMTADFGEGVWVRYVMTGFNGSTQLDMVQGVKIAFKGWGYFEQGPNPGITTNTMSDVSNNYLTFGNQAWKADLQLPSTSASTINTLVRRTNISNNPNAKCEPKYYVYQIVFLNKNGVFEGFSFPKASYETTKGERKDYYRLSRSPQNYSTTNHYKNNLLSSSYTEIKLNTDLLQVKDIENLRQLNESQLHYLIDEDNNILPVILKQQDFIIKSSVNDKVNIQYEFTFEYANEVKNNIR